MSWPPSPEIVLGDGSGLHWDGFIVPIEFQVPMVAFIQLGIEANPLLRFVHPFGHQEGNMDHGDWPSASIRELDHGSDFRRRTAPVELDIVSDP
jgi:hypothetical protein